MKAYLALEDGLVMEGVSCGAPVRATGELVFNTGLTGYQEILTDPSYRGQVVMMTWPLIGNYGVNDEDRESDRVQVEGFVVREMSPAHSNWRAAGSLPACLAAAGVPGISGVDTRLLTVHLRERGCLRAVIATGEQDLDRLVDRARRAPVMAGRDLATAVSTGRPYWWSREGGPKVVVLDCGVKHSILRCLAGGGRRRVLVMPARVPPEEILGEKPSLLVVSNGPGDPAALPGVVANLAALLGRLPVFGICLGHQLLGLACGGRTVKLKFGHHGSNHPVRDEAGGRVLITAQNHGFCLEDASLPAEVTLTHRNLNDGTVEGIASRRLHFASVQFHPEAGPGPHDGHGLFENLPD